MTALLEIAGVSKSFPVRAGLGGISRTLKAVDDVSLALKEGETLGIVGESGCGKTTLARLVLRLLEPSQGAIRFAGTDITHQPESALRPLRAQLQVVFQDPYSSLNPRLRVRDIIGEPLRNLGWNRARIDARVDEVLGIVGLPVEYATRYPHAFSGGQRQRIGIARALAPHPKMIVCDEAVSALDVSIRAQIIDLLIELQKSMGLAMIFISHDLAVVREISHRVLVLYLGRVMELADRDRIYQAPQHPYTKALLSAAPIPDPAVERHRQRIRLTGDPPSPLDPRAAFRFAPSRLPADPNAPILAPELREAAPGHLVAEFDA